MNSTTHPVGTRFVAADGSRATVNGWRGDSVAIEWDKGGTSYAPAHMFGKVMTEAEYDAAHGNTLTLTRNRQEVVFRTDDTDADLVQAGDFLNSAQLPIPVKDFLINGVHVVASTGPLARQAIRERNAQLDAAKVVDETPAPVSYSAPATWHPGRCYCGRFAGGHIPGLIAAIRADGSCEGDRVNPHDAATCGACLAGAIDFRPTIEAGQTWISNQHGTDHQVQGPGDEIGTWAMWGPVGNLYVISEARLYTAYTLDLDR
jgi:hypothetical protein